MVRMARKLCSPRAFQVEPEALFQERWRAFQIEPEALFQMVPLRFARSRSPEGVPRADNRTEILSPTNKQYKGRKSALRAFQGPQGAFQEPRGRSKGFQKVSGR